MATFIAPTSIAFDGTGHVANSINTWLAGLPDGATARMQPGGTYQVGSSPITLIDRHDITFDGNNATIRTDADYAGSLRPFIRVTGGSNVQVQNFNLTGRLTFLGPYSTSYTSADEWQHGVHFEGHNGGGTRANVTGCTITNVYGDGVALDPDKRPGGTGPLWIPCTNMLIANNTIDGTGRMGCSVTYGDTVTFQDMTIGHVNWWIIDIETETTEEYTNNITVQRITSGLMRYGLVSIGGGQSNQASNILIQNNTMNAMGATCQAPITSLGPSGVTPHRSGVTVKNNTLQCYQTAGSFTRHDNVTWIFNTASSTGGNGGCGADYHLGLVNVQGAYLAGNKFPNVSTLFSATGGTTSVTSAVARYLGTDAWTGTQSWMHAPAGTTWSATVVGAGTGGATVSGFDTARSGTLTAAGTGTAVSAPPGTINAVEGATGTAGATVAGRVTESGLTVGAGTGGATVDGFVTHLSGTDAAAGTGTAAVSPGSITGAENAAGTSSATVAGFVTVRSADSAAGTGAATVAGSDTAASGALTTAGTSVANVSGLVAHLSGVFAAAGTSTANIAGLLAHLSGVLAAAGVGSAVFIAPATGLGNDPLGTSPLGGAGGIDTPTAAGVGGATVSSSAPIVDTPTAAGVGGASAAGFDTHLSGGLSAAGTSGGAVTGLVGIFENAAATATASVTGRATKFSGTLAAAGTGAATASGSAAARFVAHTPALATLVFNGISDSILFAPPGGAVAVLAFNGISDSTLLAVSVGDAAIQTT